MSEEPLQEAFADEGTFSGETDESELQALVSMETKQIPLPT